MKILHTADLHMDSPFEALPSGKAAARRYEQRELLARIAELALKEGVDLVLLAGDLLDSGCSYYETGEELSRSLGRIPCPVIISPGNHDYYGPDSPYARLRFPGNVYVFKRNSIECVELPAKSVRVFGAAFTDRESRPLLDGFTADRKSGMLNIMCIHGDLDLSTSKYNPMTTRQLELSGMDYVALGHVHSASGLIRAGKTAASYPGCPEGRGFDETGEKTVNIVTLVNGQCELKTASVAGRRYESVEVSVTDTDDAAMALHACLPDDTVRDIYRVILTGETSAPINTERLRNLFSDYFFELSVKDKTIPRRNIWEKAGEDTLKGLFLSNLKNKYDAAASEEEKAEIAKAVRWGLAALDNREEVTRHDY